MADLPDEDRSWLRDLIANHKWTYARTYAKTYPHEYIVRGKGVNPRDWDRFQWLVSTYGHIQLFHGTPRAYLILDGWKYWWIEPVINRAKPPEVVYGEQWASDTRRGGPPTEWDHLGAKWDQRIPPWVTDKEYKQTRQELLGIEDGSVLNVGCGTGRLIKLAYLNPSQYLGIDPSQAMLNVHVINHPRYRVKPLSLTQYTLAFGHSWQTVIAPFGSADYLTPAEIQAADELAEDRLILMFHGSVTPEVPIRQDAMMAALDLSGVVQQLIGRWEVVMRSDRLF